MVDQISRIGMRVGAMLQALYPSIAADASFAPLEGPSAGADWTALYSTLEAYYRNNALYDELRTALQIAGNTQVRGIRSPAKRIVEAYVRNVWPGDLPEALPIESENQTIIDPIHQLWRDSNWSRRKQLFVRDAGILGDGYLWVSMRDNRPRLNLVKASEITDVELNPDGYIELLRRDIPVNRYIDGRWQDLWHTELWRENGPRAGLAVWEHKHGRERPIENLGEPLRFTPLADLGVDFVPIVKVPFIDIGDVRGIGAYTLDLEKIDEINRMASRLHHLLFRFERVLWAMTGGVGSDGRPLPAPKFRASPLGGVPDEPTTRRGRIQEQAAEIERAEEEFFGLVGNGTLQPLVPNLRYDAFLSILNAQEDDLERDRPVLGMHRVRESGGELSGKALRLMLSEGISDVLEVRGNCENGLIRAQQMALTFGQRWRSPGYEGLTGGYRDGTWEHRFAEREVIPVSEEEQADVDMKRILVLQGLGELKEEWQLLEFGFDQKKVDAIMLEREIRAEEAMERETRMLERGNLMLDDGGEGGNQPLPLSAG